MTATSYSLAIGSDIVNESDSITVGTLPPNAGDFELRISLNNTPRIEDVEVAIDAFLRRLRGQYGNQDLGSI